MKYSKEKVNLAFIVTGLYTVIWTVLAVNVFDRSAWWLENMLVFLLIGPAIWMFVSGSLSKASFYMIFVFLCFHSVGAHYTYAEVPYDQWSNKLFGRTINSIFGFERNHYDRLVHFLWGFLLYLPLRDFIYRFTKLKGALLTTFTLFAITTASTAYEMIEWVAALIFGGDLGMAYLGTQGDIWDAHKDQALAIGGSILAAIILHFTQSSSEA